MAKAPLGPVAGDLTTTVAGMPAHRAALDRAGCVGLITANPGLYLTASLAITFPFNLTIGIPIYYQTAQWISP